MHLWVYECECVEGLINVLGGIESEETCF